MGFVVLVGVLLELVHFLQVLLSLNLQFQFNFLDLLLNDCSEPLDVLEQTVESIFVNSGAVLHVLVYREVVYFSYLLKFRVDLRDEQLGVHELVVISELLRPLPPDL